MLGRGKGAHLPVVERLPPANTAAAAELQQLIQIVAVRGGRVSAHTAFVRQVRDEPVDPRALIRGHGALSADFSG
jgi:S1-C subfamily serine protease